MLVLHMPLAARRAAFFCPHCPHCPLSFLSFQPLLVAAMMTGFNQMAHFRDTFKKEFGMLPSEVVRRKKENTNPTNEQSPQ